MNLNDIRREMLSEERIEEKSFRDFVKSTQSRVASTFSSIVDKLKGFLQGIIGSVQKVLVRNINGTNIPSYEMNKSGGKILGFLYPSVMVDAMEGNTLTTKKANMAKAFLNVHENRIIVCFDENFMMNYALSNNKIRSVNESVQSGSFIGKMIKEAQEVDDIDASYSPGGEKEAATERKYAAANKAIAVGSRPPGADWLVNSPGLKEFVHTAEIKIDTFADLIDELIMTLHYRTSVKQTVPSMLLQGFPGVGKTVMVSQLREKGFKVTTIEVASMYKEVMGGFPVVENVLQKAIASGKGLSDDMINSLSMEEKQKLGEWSKEVHMKAANIFPKEDGGKHVLFLDEFNRDSEKMATAMNLILSGSIGTQYYLPVKTMVIASGNLGMSIDSVNVAAIDSATFDRFNIKALLPKNVIAGLEYLSQMTSYGPDGVTKTAGGEFLDNVQPVTEEEIRKYKVDLSGLSTALDIFFSNMVEKYSGRLKDNEGKDPAELVMNPLASQYVDSSELDSGDTSDPNNIKYLFSQRTIDKMNERLKMRVLSNWVKAKEGRENLMKVQKSFIFENQVGNRYLDLRTPADWENCFEQYKDGYLSSGVVSPIDLYLQIIQWHPTFLPTVLKTSVGGKPFKFIDNFRRVVEQSITETNNFSIEDIAFGYYYKRIYGHDIEVVNDNGKRETIHSDGDQVEKMANESVATKARIAKGYINIIKNYDTIEKISEMIKKTCKKSLPEVVKQLQEGGKGKKIKDGNDAVGLLILNFSQYCKDSKFQANNAAQMIDKFREFGLYYDANAAKVERTEKSRFSISDSGKEILMEFFGSIWQSNKAFQEAMGLKSGQSADELDQEIPTTAPAPEADPKKKAKKIMQYGESTNQMDPVLTEALQLYKKMEKRGR